MALTKKDISIISQLFNQGYEHIILPNLNRIESKVDHLESRFDSLELRFDSLETEFGVFKKFVRKIDDAQNELEKRVSRLELAGAR
ncbi:MAG: hypothetical protein Q8O95_02135 [bacterium]|nr:hypothetical protein [bacterium]